MPPGTNELQRFDLASAIFIPKGANLIESSGSSRISYDTIPANSLNLILSGPGHRAFYRLEVIRR